MNPVEIIEKYYPVDRDVYKILVAHSRDVATKALQIASMHPEMNLDLKFIEEAAMLHDIGIIYTNAPDLDCHGEYA
ncbi:MAG TPA: phosphohydrolase, partial [Porphyromonadaceae bacterium]|nr:phosphohydrolase [Porphyromonadaceae bacterium]